CDQFACYLRGSLLGCRHIEISSTEEVRCNSLLVRLCIQLPICRTGSLLTAASHLEKAFSGCERRVVKMNGAIYGRTGSSVPKQRRRRYVMSFEMGRVDRASSEPLYHQLYRQIREELESGSFDSSASRV